eukprot:9480122-Pyramimonas_sp.AAC.1
MRTALSPAKPGRAVGPSERTGASPVGCWRPPALCGVPGGVAALHIGANDAGCPAGSAASRRATDRWRTACRWE